MVLLRPAPVQVRSIQATALAYTVTHVLVEWEGDVAYQPRWEASWLVRRMQMTPEHTEIPKVPFP